MSSPDIDTYNELRERYSHLCLHFNGIQDEKCRRRFLDDFDELAALPFLSTVGVDFPNRLVVLTKLICLRHGPDTPWRRIGAFVIELTKKAFLCTNVTGPIVTKDNVYHHPHIQNTDICMGNAMNDLRLALGGGRLLYVIKCLGVVLHSAQIGGYQASAVSNWPQATPEEVAVASLKELPILKMVPLFEGD